MTPRLAALVKQVAEFTLLVAGACWRMNAHISTIQAASLLIVRSLTPFITADGLILLI
jgi:hypothetical protein